MSSFDINLVVFHFDDFNYRRRSQPYFFLTIATQLGFFFINYYIICVDPLYCFLDNNSRSRAVLTASRAPGKSRALGPIPTQPLILIGIKL